MKLNEQMWRWDYIYKWTTNEILQIKCTPVHMAVQCIVIVWV